MFKIHKFLSYFKKFNKNYFIFRTHSNKMHTKLKSETRSVEQQLCDNLKATDTEIKRMHPNSPDSNKQNLLARISY